MSEACGAQRLTARRNAEASLLLLLIPPANFSSSSSQGLRTQREQHGDREEAHAYKELPPSTVVLPSAR